MLSVFNVAIHGVFGCCLRYVGYYMQFLSFANSRSAAFRAHGIPMPSARECSADYVASRLGEPAPPYICSATPMTASPAPVTSATASCTQVQVTSNQAVSSTLTNTSISSTAANTSSGFSCLGKSFVVPATSELLATPSLGEISVVPATPEGSTITADANKSTSAVTLQVAGTLSPLLAKLAKLQAHRTARPKAPPSTKTAAVLGIQSTPSQTKSHSNVGASACTSARGASKKRDCTPATSSPSPQRPSLFSACSWPSDAATRSCLLGVDIADPPPYTKQSEEVPQSPQAMLAQHLLHPPVTPSRTHKHPAPINIPHSQSKHLPTSHPSLSSPLSNHLFIAKDMIVDEQEDDLGFGWPTFTTLFVNPIWANAYNAGNPAAVLADIQPATGILAPNQDVFEGNTNLDIAGTPAGLAEANISLKTLGVRLGQSGPGYIAGNVIRISQDGTTGVAARSSARAIAVQPHNGLSVAMFFDDGWAHAEWSTKETLSKDTAKTVREGGQEKCRRLSTMGLTEPMAKSLSPKLPMTRMYGRSTRKMSSTLVTDGPSAPTSVYRTPGAGHLAYALTSVTRAHLTRVGITSDAMKVTALLNIREELLEKIPVWGKCVACIIQVTLELEGHKSLPVDTLAFSNKSHRPAPIGQFARSHQCFQDNVFNTFKADFKVNLWKWWILLVEDMRVFEGSGRDWRPGPIRIDADWLRLLVRGQNGFWQVVVTVLVWRKHIKRQGSSANVLDSWTAFAMDVELVFDALLDSLLMPKVKKVRSS
jgi:hypothetical protein